MLERVARPPSDNGSAPLPFALTGQGRIDLPFPLGSEVEDNVTGLTGVALGVAAYHDGRVQYQVQPRVIENGKPVDSTWIDSSRLTVVEKRTAGFKA